MDFATTDVTLKMKRFPLLFFPCSPVTPKSAPCYFFRGISLETLMKSGFVDDFVVFWPPFCDSPLYFAPVIPENSETSSDPTASSASQSVSNAYESGRVAVQQPVYLHHRMDVTTYRAARAAVISTTGSGTVRR